MASRELEPYTAAAQSAVEEFYRDDAKPHRELWLVAVMGDLQWVGRDSDEGDALDYRAIAKRLVANARDTLTSLNDEIRSLQQRSSYLVAATALLIVGLSVQGKSATPLSQIVGVAAITLTGVTLVSAILPFAPPFWRAWAKPYLPSAYISLMATTPFMEWCWYTYLADRRTPVVTNYKRAHSVAVPALVVAAALIVLGLVLNGLR